MDRNQDGPKFSGYHQITSKAKVRIEMICHWIGRTLLTFHEAVLLAHGGSIGTVLTSMLILLINWIQRSLHSVIFGDNMDYYYSTTITDLCLVPG